MSQTNLYDVQLYEVNRIIAKQTLLNLEFGLQQLNVILDSRNYQKNGNINELNKLLLTKAKKCCGYIEEFSKSNIDLEVYSQDDTIQGLCEKILVSLESLIDELYNSKNLNDFDNDPSVRADNA